MIVLDLFLQAGCVADGVRPTLAASLEAASLAELGADAGPVEIRWTVIRKGFGFRGGHPSTTSLVRGRIPDGCDPKTRANLLRVLGTTWCDVTGAGEDEVVVSARDWSWSG